MRKWDFYTAKELTPRGWLMRQLRIQAAGLGGNLYKVWPDVRNSAWIGGDREGWERVPYWLDGFIPLAYLTRDEELIAAAKKYVDAILAAQEPDGWICPCPKNKRARYDTWAVQLISKTLTVYCECSGDARVPQALYNVLKNYYELLKSGEIPFSQDHPPVTVKANLRRIDWGLKFPYRSVCRKTPRSTAPRAPAEPVALIPYGCARLRMTELPVLENETTP